MKKFFTLFAVLAAGIGLASAQTSVTWSLTDSSNQLGGTSTDERITVSDATYGSELNLGAVKTYNEGKGTLFMPKESKEYTSPRDGGVWDVNFTFSVPEGYGFTPSSVSFFSAADGSGNKHLLDAYINSTKFVNEYQPGRGSSNAETKTYTIAGVDKLEGDITVVIRLYGKPGGVTKGWSIGNLVVAGELVNLSDTRTKADLAWDTDKISLKVRDPFTSPVLSNPDNLSVTYATSNEKVATVDADGVVTLVEGATGTTIISATYNGDVEGAEYLTTTANVTIEVVTNEEHHNFQDPSLVKATVEVDNIFYATKSSYDAGKIFGDEYLTVEGYSKTAQGKVSGNYAGYEFSNSLQVRVLHDPNEEDYVPDNGYGGAEFGDGTKADETTALKIIPQVNMTLYVFGRRQSLEAEDKKEISDDVENNVITIKHYFGYTPNDGKSIKCIKAGDVADNVIPQEILFGMWSGNNEESHEYLYVVTKIDLEAGQEYELFAVATTYHVNGIGYVNNDKDPNVVEFKNQLISYNKDNVNGEGVLVDGLGYSVARTGGKAIGNGSEITVDGKKYTGIKMKGIITGGEQIKYTFTAPEGKIVTAAKIYAVASSETPSDALYISKVGNHSFNKFQTTPIVSHDGTNPDVIEFDHIMHNSFEVWLHSGLENVDDISIVVDLVTTADHHAVAAPSLMLDGVDHDSEEAELAGEARLLHVVAAEGHYAYFHFDHASAAPAAVIARAEAAEDAETPEAITVNGKEFRLAPAEGIEIAKIGTLSYLSHNPDNGLKSEVKTLSVVGTAPETTGIESVAVDNNAAEVEYYNLQGIRVNNPANGVFIRRQGNDVKKVIL